MRWGYCCVGSTYMAQAEAGVAAAAAVGAVVVRCLLLSPCYAVACQQLLSWPQQWLQAAAAALVCTAAYLSSVIMQR